MEPMLNEREMEYVNSLLKWDRLRLRLGWFFMALLIVGGLLFVITAIVTVRNLNDRSVEWVAVPGIVIALSFVVIAVGGIQWLKQRHLIASILTKLLHKS